MRDRITPTVESIAVIGAGTMGHGIARVAAGAGYRVILRDLDRDSLARGIQAIERNLKTGEGFYSWNNGKEETRPAHSS